MPYLDSRLPIEVMAQRGRAKSRLMSLRALADLETWLAAG